MAPNYEMFKPKEKLTRRPEQLFPGKPAPHPLVLAAFQRGLFGHAAKLQTHLEVNPNLRENLPPAIPREALRSLLARPTRSELMLPAPGARGRAGEVHYMPSRLAVTRTAALLQRLDQVRARGGSLRDAVKSRRN